MTSSEKPKVLVLRTAGTNCDVETIFAFESFGAEARSVHINQLLSGKVSLNEFHILAFPGGFTYGDDIAAGRILANEIKRRLGKDLSCFMAEGKLVIGICNGFQVLVSAGILPGPLDGGQWKGQEAVQNATLTNNDSGKFEDRWTYLKVSGNSVWTQGLDGVFYIPVAHAEGKFIPADDNVLKKLQDNGQIAFQYTTADGGEPDYPQNPNGSTHHIAGITDQTGRILGLMPHPERHLLFTQHPFWTRLDQQSTYGQGAKIFENGVNYVRANLLQGVGC